MTSKERVLAAMRRQPVDHVPCSPFFNPLSPQERVGRPYQYPFGPTMLEMIDHGVNELDVDMTVILGGWPCADEGRILAPDEGVTSRAWMDGDVIHKVWSTPSGDLHAAVTYDERWPHGVDIPFFDNFNIGHFVEPWITCMQDVDCIRHVLAPVDRKQDWEKIKFRFKTAKALADKYNLPFAAYIGGGLTNALQLIGPERLCLMTLDQPDVVEAYLDVDSTYISREMEIALDFGVDIIWRDGFYETADLYGPRMLEQFLGKRLRAESRMVHEAGKLQAYVVNTGVMPILDYLSTLDFDCLFGVDLAFQDIDPLAIWEKLHDRRSFWVGPSNPFHLSNTDPEVTRAAVRQVFETFGKEGLILSPCVSSHSITPWSSTAAMVDEWKKLR
jgi:uroporphyrinogen-III decarboxylase